MTRSLSMAFRSLLARPARSLLTLCGIVLGVAVILAISITNLSTLESLTSVFSAASGKAHLVVFSATDNGEGFPERTRGLILNTPGVLEAIPSLQVTALLAGDISGVVRDANFFGGSENRLIFYGIDPAIDSSVREYKITSGQFLAPDLEPYEAVLVKDYADDQGIEVGDDVMLLIPPDRAETVRVVGVMAKEGAGQTNNGAFGVMPLKAAQDIFGRAGDLDQIDIVAARQEASGTGLDALQVRLQERLGSAYTVTYPASQGKRVVQMLDVYQMGLSFFSVISIIVGAFLIYNTFSMTVVERTREIGMLRTVGMTSRQVIGLILTEASILGVVGAGLGVVAGTLLSRGLTRVMEHLLGLPVSAVRVPADGLILSVVVGLGVTFVASGLPAFQAGRISPMEALRIRGARRELWWVRRGWPWGIGLLCLSILGFYLPIAGSLRYVLNNVSVTAMSIGATFLIPAVLIPCNRLLGPILRRVYGNEGQMGSGNIERSKQRTTLTVVGLMVSVAMVFSIQSLAASFRHDVQAWISAYIGGDLYVYSSQPLRSDFGQRLEAVPGVVAVTPMRRIDVKVLVPDGSHDTLAFYAYEPASYRQVTSFVFSDTKADSEQLLDRLAGGDVLFVSTVVADKYNLEPGDVLRLETRRGQQAFEVGAIVTDFNDRGLVIEGSWKDLRRYFGVNDVSAFQVKLAPGTSQGQAKDAIERLYGQRRHLTIESSEALKAEAMSVLTQAFSMFDVLAFIAVIVAALGVINTLTMNVLERTREIGMLRGVGMTRRQVSKMILAEAVSLGIIGGISGLLLGLYMSRLFVGGANLTQGYRLPQVLPLQGLVTGLAIGIIVSQIAAMWPAHRAASLQVIEAIQFE